MNESGIVKSFPLSAETPPFSDCGSLIEISGQKQYFYLGKNNDIIIYDIEKEIELKRVNVEVFGPNGVGTLKAFTPLADSTIYVFGLNTFEISKIDYEGKVLERFSFLNSNNQLIAGNSFPKSIVGGPVYSDDHNLSFATLPQGLWSNLSEDFLHKYKLEAVINLETKKVDFLPMTYPDGYHNSGNYHVHYHRIRKEDDYVYSFSTDHNVYKYQSGRMSKFEAKSIYLEKPLEKYETGSTEEYINSIIELPRYRHILFDPYRNVYYRFVYLGDELDSRLEMDGVLREQIKYLSNLSIIILDEDMNKIGETKLTSNKFLPSNYFITEEGLFISTNNPSNPEMSESVLVFELIQLKKK